MLPLAPWAHAGCGKPHPGAFSTLVDRQFADSLLSACHLIVSWYLLLGLAERQFHVETYIKSFPFRCLGLWTPNIWPRAALMGSIYSHWCERCWDTALPSSRARLSHADKQLNRTFLLPTTIRRISRIYKGERLLYHELP